MSTRSNLDVAPIVIVGAGHAGGVLAQQLQQQGINPVLLIGMEVDAPYERPSLSKAFLSDTDASPRFLWSQLPEGITWRKAVQVTRIDPQHKQITLSTDETIAYHLLVLATGGRARPLPQLKLDHVTQSQLLSLRTAADARQLRSHCQPGQRWLIIGGGFIGLEVAATLSTQGINTTVIEAGSRVLGRTASPSLSNALAALHHKNKVTIHCQRSLTALQWHPERKQFSAQFASTQPAIELTEVERSAAFDHVLVAIGLIPNTELAAEANLTLSAGGVHVNSILQTSDPDIFAIGDLASFPDAYSGQIRRESWHNAQTQAEFLAQHLLRHQQGLSTDKTYQVMPWFWSDQFDYSIQVMGYPTLARHICRRIVETPNTGPQFIDFGLTTTQQIVSIEACGGTTLQKEVKLAQRLLEKSMNSDWRADLTQLTQAPLKSIVKALPLE